jgi:hypothetical protein
MSFVRFLIFLSLGIWLGMLVFFPVVAHIAFSIVAPPHLAGMVVRGSLIYLHWFGLACGLVFLICSVVHNRVVTGRSRLFALRPILVLLMMALTAVSQFIIIPRMDALRLSAGSISLLPPENPVRLQFDSLHAWSVHLEEAVLILGLIALYAVARRFSSSRA